MQRAILFDIDGTLTTTVSGATFKQHSRDVIPMQGVIEGLKYYYNQAPRWELIGISNQGGVAAGHKTIEDAIAEMTYTLELLPQLSVIYFCPDYKGNILYKISALDWEKYDRSQFPHPNVKGELLYDSFRKPGNGMIMKAIDDLDEMPDQVWMVGDRAEDEQAAQTAGINFMWVDIWRDRFKPGMYEVNPAAPEQIEFLEGVKISENLVNSLGIKDLLQPPELN